MDLIEDIGPILGIVAFLGFAILALLIVLQAREVRRLREWAGRAPERADDADDADRAAAEARGEITPEDERPGRLARWRERVAQVAGPRWAELDRRSPVDPRWFLAAILAALIAVGVVTGGFGLTGGDEAPQQGSGERGQREQGDREQREPKAVVAVLNATQIDDPGVPPVDAVPGIADVVAEQVVEPADFKIGVRTNAPAGEPESLIMFQPDASEEAGELAEAIEPELGQTGSAAITDEIAAIAGDADLVLLVGQDDATYGQ